MLIRLSRTQSNALSTIGELAIDGDEPICLTLEDAFHVPKIPGSTRIPAGRYRVTFRTEGKHDSDYLKRFGADFHKGMLWIRNVPDFEFILIHCGNEIGDTLGCVLIGMRLREQETPESAFAIMDSEKAYRRFYPAPRDALLRGEDVFIEVEDDPRPDPVGS